MSIDGQALPTGNLVGEQRDRESLRRSVWLRLIADGVRTLALTGRTVVARTAVQSAVTAVRLSA